MKKILFLISITFCLMMYSCNDDSYVSELEYFELSEEQISLMDNSSSFKITTQSIAGDVTVVLCRGPQLNDCIGIRGATGCNDPRINCSQSCECTEIPN